MTKFITTIKDKKVFDSPPIWLMRQAGRYLPEYRELKTHAKDFMDFCYTPKLASEATLQPIERFGFDAAIIFSDILVIPNSLGIDVKFSPGMGPILKKTESTADLLAFKKESESESVLSPVFEALALTRSKLARDKTLIGFSGAPWTLACYMIEGGSSKNFDLIRRKSLEEPEFFDNLIEILTDRVASYLSKQIEAGANAIKLFDSHAGILPPTLFRKFVIQPSKKIVSKVRALHPNTPIICFPKGASFMYEEFAENIRPDVIAIDALTPRTWAIEKLYKKFGSVIQGNLDNYTLAFGTKDEIKSEVSNIINDFKGVPFIFNLGHGILKETPIDNVSIMINQIRMNH